jgi:hypothetical protein
MRRPFQLAALLALVACLVLALTGSLGSASAASTCPVEPPPQEEPAPPPPPVEPPASSGLQPGLNLGIEAADFTAAGTLGAHLARVEFGLSESELLPHIQAVAALLAKTGTTLQPLIGFYGRVPSAAEAQRLGAVAKAVPSVKRFEFGNETSYGYQYGDGSSSASYKARARSYAVLVKEAAVAVSPYGDVVLAQAEDGGSGTSVWVDEMFASVPALSSYVGGWVIHTYGTGGPAKLERMIAQLAKHGETKLPIDVTEDGIASDNGRSLSNNFGFPTNLTYAQAGQLLTEHVSKLEKIAGSRLRSFLLYQDRDQKATGTSSEREAYFGALQRNSASKGAYTTAVKALLAE